MDEASLHIAAPAEVVYDLVADITDMGRWSPETHRAAWVAPSDRAEVGARFRGWNRATVAGLPARWRTTAVVRRADRGHAFSFDVPFSGARWTYRFVADDEADDVGPDGRGCTVTETREVIGRPLPTRGLEVFVGRSRARQLAAGLATTLARLQEAAEGR